MKDSKITLNEILASIEPKSREQGAAARSRIESLTMPHWALGRLLDLAVDLASMTRSLKPRVSRKKVFVMAADHGITEEGVSLYPKEVTAQMVANFISGGAAVNVLSRQMGAEVVVVDLGVDADFNSLNSTWTDPGTLVHAKIRKGTFNFLKQPAMTRSEAERSVLTGALLAVQNSGEVDLFATGDMGIGNTTSSAAMSACLMNTPVEVLVGRGTGIDDQRLIHKTRIIEQAILLHSPSKDDGLEVLSRVGGFEIGAIAGLILGAAASRRPVLVDGYISTVGALLAHQLCPSSLDYVIASHISAERGHSLMWKFLGKTPLLDLGLRLGEGTGAVLAMPLVEAAVRILSEMATFEDAGVSRSDSP